MNRPEAVMLVRYVRAICPQQKFDEYTPDVWHDLLGEYPFDDCKDAARTVGRRQPFIAPAEIITEVRRVRAERIEAAPHVMYDGNPDETAHEFTSNLRQLRRAVGDGQADSPAAIQAIPGRRPLELEPGPQGRLQQALARIGVMPPRLAPGVANPMAVACPNCAALPGKPCHGPSGRKHRDPHPSRVNHARRTSAGLTEEGAA